MTDIHPLEPLSFPLQGKQLIEASAGTGKTYTITALYLRLLLGLGLANRPLGPEQILVVTFTEAATEELRDRIRARIVEAREALITQQSGDPLLSQLIASLENPEQSLQLLEQALRQMDEAAIYTIHGFCQRMLTQHAFESGSLFERELTIDDHALIKAAVYDFWRNQIYRLSDTTLEQVLQQCWKGPDQLLFDVRGILGRPQVKIEPDLSDLDLEQQLQKRRNQLTEFKNSWQSNEDDLLALLQNSAINKRSYSKGNLPKWLNSIGLYCDSLQQEPDKKLFETLERFTPQRLAEKTAEGGEVPQHPLFDLIGQVVEQVVPAKEILLCKALKEVSARLKLFKQQYQTHTFDDLLTDLNQALHNEHSEQLVTAIRKQYPLAMIDEFQDTDPLQYGIFSQLYSDPFNSGLIMIGDPKQAIYAFRGADIFTYIQARRSVTASYTLDTNWRSTAEMVQSVNALFEVAPQPFIYHQDIPFYAVKDSGRARGDFTIEGQKQAALQFWLREAEEPVSNSDYLSTYARATASQIDLLLNSKALLGDKPVSGGDIAVLVRDRFEAEEIRHALSLYERPCVYLSNQDSVFHSRQAFDLALLLTAVENPRDDRALRACLASELMQLNLADLERMIEDERLWEAVITEFSEYQMIWKKQGVMPMLSRLLHRRELSSKLLQQMDGERSLTNLMHLMELLQQASTRFEGMGSLMRWFNEQVTQSEKGEEQILRLESEQDLVTIVTVHKSKGLEYPIVFLPFASRYRETKSGFYHDEQQRLILNLQPTEQDLAEVQQEILAEELRLLYVALTRSVYACYVGVAHTRYGNSKQSQLHNSAIGYLLSQNGETVEHNLEQLRQQKAIAVTAPPEAGFQPGLFAMEPEEAKVQYSARQFAGEIRRDWRISSYSGLTRSLSHAHSELPGIDLEVLEEKVLTPEETGKTIFSFPRGANAGTFLHTLFEETCFEQYNPEAYRETYLQLLQVAGYEEHWLPVIEQLVDTVLSYPLSSPNNNPFSAPGDGQELRLADTLTADRLVEMEFVIPSKNLCVEQLEAVIKRYNPLSAQAGQLQFDPLTGMLKGYIDLLFRHDGRYYVLDYKSNHLGDEISCYSQRALEEAMIDHRYDLQYLLYTLAVHRLLKKTLPDYSYQTHMGGVYYLFLRGMDESGEYGVFYDKPDEVLIEQLDQLFQGEC